ncbi:unnamed protein product, partial [Pylaiella littoralis]
MLLASKDHPHGCQLCLCDVGGYPSIGIPTDEKDDRGYTGGSKRCMKRQTSDVSLRLPLPGPTATAVGAGVPTGGTAVDA